MSFEANNDVINIRSSAFGKCYFSLPAKGIVTEFKRLDRYETPIRVD